MNYLLFIPFISFVACFVTAFFINVSFPRKKKIPLLLSWFLYLLAIVSILEFSLLISHSFGTIVALDKTRFSIVLIIMALLCHFSGILVNSRFFKKWYFKLLVYVPVVLLIIFRLFSDLVMSELGLDGYSELIVSIGWLYWMFLGYIVFVLVCVGYSLANYYSQIENTKEKSSIGLMSISVVIGILGVLMVEISYIIYGISLVPWLSFLSVVVSLVFAIVFFRFNFMRSDALLLGNIRSRILFPIGTFVFTLLLSLSVIMYIFFHGTLENEIISKLDSLMSLRMSRVENFLNEQKEEVFILTRDHHFSDLLISEYGLDPENIEEIEGDRYEHYQEVIDNFKKEGIVELLLLDRDGKVVLSTNRDNVGEIKEGEKYFSEGLNGVFADVNNIVNMNSGYVIPVSAPVTLERDDSPGSLGVLVAFVGKSQMDEILLAPIGLGGNERLYLISGDGEFITPYYRGEDNYFGNKSVNKHVLNCKNEANLDINDRAESSFNRYGEEILISHLYSSSLGWCIVFEVDNEEIFSVVNGMLRFIVVIGLISLIISYFIINYISRNITNPIAKLKKGLEIVSRGNLEYKVGMEGNDEISVLSREFDRMNSTIVDFKKNLEDKVASQTLDITMKNERLEKQQRAILNILEDVEKEKERSEELAHDLRKFKLAVDNASDHIIITDIDGIVLYANEAVEKITGFSIDNIIGQKAGTKDNWGGLMSKEFYANIWRTLKEKKEAYSGELKNKRKSGEEYDVQVSISPIVNSKGEILFFVAIERDITKEKEVDRAKTEFVSLASHQLRTPLSAISWYTEMLLDGDAGKVNDKQKEYLNEIYDGNQRMIELVGALLNVSRIEMGTFSIEPEAVNLVEVSDSIIGEMEPEIKSKNLNFLRDYDKEIGDIKLDRKLITIVFQNLISNAVKYTPEKGKIVVSINKREDDVMIIVADTGYGIPARQQDKIFGKLFRADNVLEKETDGTGLGLYIVKSIVEEIGGKIWFNSEENKGTVFYVAIPLKGIKGKTGIRRLN